MKLSTYGKMDICPINKSLKLRRFKIGDFPNWNMQKFLWQKFWSSWIPEMSSTSANHLSPNWKKTEFNKCHHFSLLFLENFAKSGVKIRQPLWTENSRVNISCTELQRKQKIRPNLYGFFLHYQGYKVIDREDKKRMMWVFLTKYLNQISSIIITKGSD